MGSNTRRRRRRGRDQAWIVRRACCHLTLKGIELDTPGTLDVTETGQSMDIGEVRYGKMFAEEAGGLSA